MHMQYLDKYDLHNNTPASSLRNIPLTNDFVFPSQITLPFLSKR